MMLRYSTFLLGLLLVSSSTTNNDQVIVTAQSSATTCSSTDGTCAAADNGNGVFVLPPKDQPKCGLYMAPSTLGEGANLGMYAGIDDIPTGAVIQKEIALPLMFRDWEGPNYFHQYPGVIDGDQDDGALWYRYIWSGFVADIETYNPLNIQESKVVFVPGIGCTINSILDMRNVHSTHGSVYDTAGLPRSDPSAGAFGPYHSSETSAVVDIPAGSEIFADYGDEWIPDIPGAQITFDNNMNLAEDFLREDYIPFVQHLKTKFKKEVKPDLLEGLWNFTRSIPHPRPRIFTVLPREVSWQEIEQQYESFTKEEAPILAVQAEQMKNDPNKIPNPPYYTEKTSLIRHFIRHLGKRSLDWLVDMGRCCDHMEPGNSTIPHAGRGAFATRDLPKGTIVGYSPVVHVGTHGRDLYNIPYQKGPNGTLSYNKSDLILNYALGHPESTVLLSPYGSMVNYINHAPTLSEDPSKPTANVRLVWPPEEMMAHKPAWLQKDITFLTHTVEKIGLSFDYVALRDIQKGEEILMDYGPEWEQAWNEHVKNWVPPEDADRYVHSHHWPETTVRTAKEQEENPYPPNLHTMCYPAYMWNPQKQGHYYLELNRENKYIDRVKCTVIERREHLTDPDNKPEKYTVDYHFEDDRGTIRILNVPRDGIDLTDRVFSQDWHLPNTFRHPIKIPDDIFPESWKNLKR